MRAGERIYSPEVVEYILDELSKGRPLAEICRERSMPAHPTVYKWVNEDRDGFAERFERARKIGYMLMFDELLAIADDGRNDWMQRNDPDNPGWAANGEHLQRSRLRVDTRKWALAKALPRIFGEKTQHEHGGTDGNKEIVQRLQIEVVSVKPDDAEG